MKNFYQAIEGDYEGTIARLLTEERIKKYVLRFLNIEDYNNLVSELANENWPEAFRAVHNLKGVSLNLGFSKLAASSSELCEAIRNGAPTIDVKPLMYNVTKDYNKLIEEIKKIA